MTIAKAMTNTTTPLSTIETAFRTSHLPRNTPRIVAAFPRVEVNQILIAEPVDQAPIGICDSVRSNLSAMQKSLCSAGKLAHHSRHYRTCSHS
jgi:hypothetical protein